LIRESRGLQLPPVKPADERSRDREIERSLHRILIHSLRAIAHRPLPFYDTPQRQTGGRTDRRSPGMSGRRAAPRSSAQLRTPSALNSRRNAVFDRTADRARVDSGGRTIPLEDLLGATKIQLRGGVRSECCGTLKRAYFLAHARVDAARLHVTERPIHAKCLELSFC
jgi:hypothetical protein